MIAAPLESFASFDSVRRRIPHSLHRSTNAKQFCLEFDALTGRPVESVADQLIAPSAPRAIFLVGSLPLGMGTGISDVDFMVLIDSPSVLLPYESSHGANGDRHLPLSEDSDALRAGVSITLDKGLVVDVTLVVAPMITQIYKALRKRGPELSDLEIRTLGWLSSGWLLWESDNYIARRGIRLPDQALDVYCSTRNFSIALIFLRKAEKVLELTDIPLALHLGRSSVEMAYLAYFASEGLSYLGPKWLAQLGHARGSLDRVSRYPLLKEGIPLMFPSCESTIREAECYLREVSQFLASMRDLISRNALFQIAFDTCPQIFSPL